MKTVANRVPNSTIAAPSTTLSARGSSSSITPQNTPKIGARTVTVIDLDAPTRATSRAKIRSAIPVHRTAREVTARQGQTDKRVAGHVHGDRGRDTKTAGKTLTVGYRTRYTPSS